MPRLTYAARGRSFSSAGRMTVTDADREIATVDAVSGGFLRGPSWTWSGAFGVEWMLVATRSDRFYEVRTPDGGVVGRITRSFASSAVSLESADGGRATVAARAPFTRVHHVTLSQGTATVTRESSAFNLTSSELWVLDTTDGAATGQLYLTLLALPIALDHRRRRQRQSGGSGGG